MAKTGRGFRFLNMKSSTYKRKPVRLPVLAL
jgi:hypothetical protein